MTSVQIKMPPPSGRWGGGTANNPDASLRDHENPVVVAMIAVRVVEMAFNQIVNVATVRNRRVAAGRAVNMVGGVFLRGKARRAGLGIGSADFDGVLVVMAVVRVMQMTGIQIVHMTIVPDGHMAAIRAVLMGVIGVRVFTGGARNGQGRDSGEGEDECFVHSFVG